MKAIQFILFLFYLSCLGCYGWASPSDTIQSLKGPSVALAPTSQSKDHWQIMLDKLRQRRLEYGAKWQGVPWNKHGVQVGELRNLFVVLVALAPEDRKIFQQVRNELCWWILLARSSEIWNDKTEYYELDEMAQHALQQLYDRVPLAFDIRGKNGMERILRHWLNPFHFLGWGQKIVIVKGLWWWLDPRNWLNRLIVAWQNMQIRRALLQDEILEKSLWMMMDPVDLVSVEIDSERFDYGRFKSVFRLRIWDSGWNQRDLILKLSIPPNELDDWMGRQPDIAEQASIFMHTEPSASMLFSDPDSDRFPLVGVWGDIRDVHVETMHGDKSLTDLIRDTWPYQSMSKKVDEMQKIVEAVVDIFLIMNDKAYPCYTGFGDEAMSNVRVLQNETELRLGKIDFGNTKFFIEPGIKVYETIWSVTNAYYRFTYLNENSTLKPKEWLEAFIRAFYMRGKLDYIKSYVRYLKWAIVHSHPEDKNHDIAVTALHDLSSILYGIVSQDFQVAQTGYSMEDPGRDSQIQKLDYLYQLLLFLERLILESPGGTGSERLMSVRTIKAEVRILREHGKLPDRFLALAQSA